ncbi:hypothetical protein [Rhodococcus sp. SORGH_AS_0303]|uniref:hypothetical protein n=1 Tax=Rhodococcus sp. SORGH_AS_0303 TaxID=3041753 RepID=UPI00278AE2CE|nr:hypothetical protein [Rhodococcus sp. SORGH_AS_0303]MDQ1202834.1 hypothetical protein [Rhodococcus sp. SORGH_AS_0303]
MSGHLTSLAGLPGRFVATSFDAERQMIVVEISDAEGNLKGSMSWGYQEPAE